MKTKHQHEIDEMKIGIEIQVNMPVVTAVIAAAEYALKNKEDFGKFVEGCEFCPETLKQMIPALQQMAGEAVKQRKLQKGNSVKN